MKTEPKGFLLAIRCTLLLTFVLSFSSSHAQNDVFVTRTPSERTFHAINTLDCNGSLGDPIVNINFGGGASFGAALPAGVTTLQYVGNSCPNDGSYTITSYTSGCFGNSWYSVSDHTGNNKGYFMLVNASYDPSDFYVQKVDGLCSGTTYQFSAWIVNVMNRQAIEPDITFSIEKTDGTVLQSYNSGKIPYTSTPVWKQYGMYFTMPAGVTSVVIRMRNNAPGGIGNDLGLDDIAFRPAGPSTKITPPSLADSLNICEGSVDLSGTVEDCYLANEYQWQENINGSGWTNIAGATTTAYTMPEQTPGKYKYRLLVSQEGNIGISSCRVSSNVTTVVVVAPQKFDVDTAICSGSSYTLPSGKTVSATGTYLDTARYKFGCDSIITNLKLTVQQAKILNTTAVICQGESYELPSGESVTTSGVYRDTLKYKSGCDSLIRIVDLTVQGVTVNDSAVIICQGQSITLPWGKTVSSTGTYSDTLRYTTGCDSLIRHVHVHVTVPVFQSIEASICPYESYTLPSGALANKPGLYQDTLRTDIGCDSIITTLSLAPSPPPEISITKSNDVNCTLGISKLHASGGAQYVWSPAESLSNAFTANPVASPEATTVYRVTVTNREGCVGEDSIIVNVSTDGNGVYLPNAFTPNGDGMNDCFGIRFLGKMSNLRFSIYDRWGNRVFYTTDPDRCWDGNSNNKPMPSGVFVYFIKGTTICGDISKTGTVTLIR